MSLFNINLKQTPLGFKLLISVFLLGYSLAQAFGLWMAYIQTRIVNTSAEEYFFYLKKFKLISLSHPHFFGYTTLYGITGFLFLFTHQKKLVKNFLPPLVLTAALIDIGSWWGIKYVSAKMEIISALGGIIFGSGFVWMAIVIFYELWFRKG